MSLCSGRLFLTQFYKRVSKNEVSKSKNLRLVFNVLNKCPYINDIRRFPRSFLCIGPVKFVH